jgi:hypothetical protein
MSFLTVTISALGPTVYACERQEIQKESEINARKIGKKIKENIKFHSVDGWELRTKYSSYKIPQKYFSISYSSDTGGVWNIYLKSGDSIINDAKRKLMPMWLGYQTAYSIEQFDYVTGIRQKGKKTWQPININKSSGRLWSEVCATQDETGITAPMEAFNAKPTKAEGLILPNIRIYQTNDGHTRVAYNKYLDLEVRAENIDSNIDSLVITMKSEVQMKFGIGKDSLCKQIYERDSLCFRHTGNTSGTRTQ